MTKDVEAVLAANQAFYDAFAAADMQAMEAVWATAAPVACAHPGAPLLVGRAPVLESWGQILGGGSSPEIQCLEPQAHLLERAAFVTCYERLGGAAGATLLATNVFTLEASAWRMVHHHAGPTPISPPQPARQSSPPVLH